MEGPVEIEPPEPPQLAGQHLQSSKFTNMPNPTVLSSGSIAPHIPGVFSEEARPSSPVSEHNFFQGAQFIGPPLLVSAIAVPFEDNGEADTDEQDGDSASVRHDTNERGGLSDPEQQPSSHLDSQIEMSSYRRGHQHTAKEGQSLSHGRRLALCLAFSTLAVVLAATVVTVAVTFGVGQQPASPESESTPTPSTVSTLSVDRHEDIRNIILASGVSSVSDLSDSSSPQYKAFVWLAEKDAASIPVNDHGRVLQRYAVAVLYYATGGEGWISQDNFLSVAHECKWSNGKRGVTACNNENGIATILLFFNNLVGSIPNEIGSLKSLEYVNLVGNTLPGPIPDGIGSLTRLAYLGLPRNYLRGPIPDSLGSLTNLMTLDLKQNKLSGSVPSTLTNMKSATTVWLEDNDLTGSLNFLCDSRQYLPRHYSVDKNEVECKCCFCCPYDDDDD